MTLHLFATFILSISDMRLLYNIGIYLYVSVARIMSLFDVKARQWTVGRKGWEDLLRQRTVRDDKYIWWVKGDSSR